MLDILEKNPIDAIIFLIILIALFTYFIVYRKDIIKRAALYAVAKAEAEWGSKTGKIKFTQAYLYLKKKYPIITFFITEDAMTELIEDSLDILQKIISCRNIKSLKPPNIINEK